MIKRIILAGFGNVGKEFVRLIDEKRLYIREKYDMDLILCGVLEKEGCIFEDGGIDTSYLINCPSGPQGVLEYAEHFKESYYNYPVLEGDILIECTQSDIRTGGPSLNYIMNSINRGMDIVMLSKGALVANFNQLMELSRKKDVKIKYSGATAAALPTMDLGVYSLAGAKITNITGILNGTTNYILNRMFEENISFEQALEEAVKKGIAEKENSMDIDGIDSASKILLLANSLMDGNYSLEDIAIKGIRNISREDILEAKNKNKVIKLLCKAYYKAGKLVLEVFPEKIDANSLLGNINGSNKGIVFHTDTMGEIYLIGGASNPRGAAAAALKDVINLCRE
ncbi:homoserine dehydrogenase [uncultured Clostridium sp.]|uniref:homoserine dehydrogenase n=1 Tax=uncultured Clostridium sp. TaxID=59620 RepID=UPI0028EE3AE6|nr:homoserine dehydrogenase [uncultured Clostridium sp.]